MPESRPPIRWRVMPASLAAVLTAACLLPDTSSAATFEFADGEGSLTFDSTFSMGLLARTQRSDRRLVGIANGGTSRSVNEDDGNLNYKRGEIVSALLKGNHDLDLSYGKSGLFVRFGYGTDFAARQKEGLVEKTHDSLDYDAELFDAYIRHEFSIADRKLNLRLGNQVVSWGESTFIPGGINVINPVDLVKLRAPGSELKEAFIPVPLLWASQQITDNITIEAFNQFKWKPFRIDPFGSFFSTTDVFSRGGTESFIGFGRTPDSTHPRNGTPEEDTIIPRDSTQHAKDTGQFGMAMRWLLPALNNTELGFYGINYHSRTPIASTTMADDATAGPLQLTGGCGLLSSLPAQLQLGAICNGDVLTVPGAPGQRDASTASIFAEYPENIQLFGLSFNTPGPFGIALQGEYSYRPNLPLQVATVELVLATLGLPNQAGYGNDLDGDAGFDRVEGRDSGGRLRGFREVEMHQFQFTALKAIPNVLRAEQVIALLEAAYVRLELPDGIKFAGPATYLPSAQGGPANGLFPYPNPLVANGSVQPGDEGYATKNSWGFRAVTRFEYADVFSGVNLFPRLVYSYDVKGVSPFLTEGTMAVSVGLNATYNQVWSADIGYTNFFGGREFGGTDCTADLAGVSGSGDQLCAAPTGPTANPQEPSRRFKSIANPNIDRDFVAASVSYSF